MKIQRSFLKPKWNHYLRHGGELRKKRAGRKSRPLSTKEPLHLVFKVHSARLRSSSLKTGANVQVIKKVIEKYTYRFSVKVEQVAIERDHIHLLIRTSRRSLFQHFFRVVAGQIAQKFEKDGKLWGNYRSVTDTPRTPRAHRLLKKKGTKLWKCRPFTRVVRGWKAYQTARNYVQLNYKESIGEIPYRKERLRGLSSADWKILWT